MLRSDLAPRHAQATTDPRDGASGAFFDRLRSAYQAGDHDAAIRLLRANQGRGRPMAPGVRSAMESRFGRDLSLILVHDDDFARRATACLGANAFAAGSDVFFGEGRYDPATPEGDRRLAHELAHVIQQQGPRRPRSPSLVAALEREAEGAADLPRHAGRALSRVGPMILREPTYPRRTTGTDMIQEVERVLGLSRDEGSSNATHRLWSRVGNNFGPRTAGSLARRVWTYIFLRHFTEPDTFHGAESAHPRYFYSHVYGWIDGQHFFGFIDFAEQQYKMSGGDHQAAFAAATKQGLKIEEDQQKIRNYVVLKRPPATDKTRLLQVDPPNTLLFRGPQAAAAAAAQGAADAVAFLSLGDSTQGQLFGLLDDAQRKKFWEDCAKSAFTYEDFRSNQLGVRFFYQHGLRINALAEFSRETEFRSALWAFFNSINVEDSQSEVDRLGAGLPWQEQFSAGKTTEELERQRHPELFKTP